MEVVLKNEEWELGCDDGDDDDDEGSWIIGVMFDVTKGELVIADWIYNWASENFPRHIRTSAHSIFALEANLHLK